MWLNLRINPTTKAKLDKLAEQSGQSRSAVVRHLIDGATIREMPPLEYHTLLAELRRIGTNLNQIAHTANSTGQIDTSAYTDNAEELRRVVFTIKTTVGLR